MLIRTKTQKAIVAASLSVLLATTFASAATKIVDYEYVPAAVLGLSLARSGNLIPEADMGEVVNSLTENQAVPRRYQTQFEPLLRTGQMLLEIESSKYYFPVGFEFETGHGTEDATENFEDGAKAIEKSVRETFGIKSVGEVTWVKKEGDDMKSYTFQDDSGSKWNVVQEFVRDEDRSTTPTGWETVSPPIFNRDYLRNLAGFVLRLGQNPYGREAEFTGAHQTYNLLPEGAKFDQRTAGLAAANYMLMMEQFAPVIFKSLEVERYGGYKNFFIRPLVFDHYEFLNALSAKNPATFSLDALNTMMNDTYAEKEFAAHINNTSYFTDEYKRTMLSHSAEYKKKYAKLWKYHDLRIHFNKKNPERTLVETRIGDYRQGSPEHIIRVTYFNQLLLARAYEMAREGKMFKINVPLRVPGETDDSYWRKLRDNRASSEAELVKTLNLDPTQSGLIRGELAKPRGAKFRALERPSYGFEMEFIGSELLSVVVPKDPTARANWRRMNMDEKIEYFTNLIADADQRERFEEEERLKYTKDARRIVTVEFEADTMRLPFLDPDLFIEDSGNFEIKSNGRDIYDEETLVNKIKKVDPKFDTTSYGMHTHLFIPDSMLQAFKTTPGLAEKAGAFLERISLLMQVEDYRTNPWGGQDHSLDSWSLDRYSQKDIGQVVSYLKGQGKIGNISQKYHNIGMREVEGGLDVELRSVGEDIPFMREMMAAVTNAFLKHQFGTQHLYGSVKPLFHDFTHSTKVSEMQRYTLYDAVSKRYPLTQAQKQILYKLQFEIYKPSMPEYMMFDDWDSHTTVKPENMDVRYARTNFESNVAIPLLNFEEQPYLQQKGLEKVLLEREKFLDKVYRMTVAIEKDPAKKFILEQKNFMYLADYMSRSTHPSKPNLNLVDKKTATAQRRILQNLVYSLRGYVVTFTKATELTQMLRNTFDAEKMKIALVQKPIVAPKFERTSLGRTRMTPLLAAPKTKRDQLACSRIFM